MARRGIVLDLQAQERLRGRRAGCFRRPLQGMLPSPTLNRSAACFASQQLSGRSLAAPWAGVPAAMPVEQCERNAEGEGEARKEEAEGGKEAGAAGGGGWQLHVCGAALPEHTHADWRLQVPPPRPHGCHGLATAAGVSALRRAVPLRFQAPLLLVHASRCFRFTLSGRVSAAVSSSVPHFRTCGLELAVVPQYSQRWGTEDATTCVQTYVRTHPGRSLLRPQLWEPTLSLTYTSPTITSTAQRPTQPTSSPTSLRRWWRRRHGGGGAAAAAT